MLIIIVSFALLIWGVAATGLAGFAGINFRTSLLIAFALSFSSTVFAVKILEEKGEMSALHGQIAIGILIMQDIIAVIFLTVSTGKIPSPWAAVLVFLLVLLRPPLMRLMDHCGHGELLLLFGFFMALVVGAAGFKLVGLKGDLGALFIGIILAGHPKASELSKALFGFKEIFLVGFFLTIGLGATLTPQDLFTALILTLLMPLKIALFFTVLTAIFNLRARTSFLTSLSLANYSEFGLIVGAVGVENGWITAEWLATIAIALSMTFIMASGLNGLAAVIFAKWQDVLSHFETKKRHSQEGIIDLGNANICLIGMGKVGTAAYDYLAKYDDINLIALDQNEATVTSHRQKGRNVICHDAATPDFWARLTELQNNHPPPIHTVLLAIRNHQINMFVATQLISNGFNGKIAAAAMYKDEVDELKKLGVDLAFNFYAEAGTGFAELVHENIA